MYAEGMLFQVACMVRCYGFSWLSGEVFSDSFSALPGIASWSCGHAFSGDGATHLLVGDCPSFFAPATARAIGSTITTAPTSAIPSTIIWSREVQAVKFDVDKAMRRMVTISRLLIANTL